MAIESGCSITSEESSPNIAAISSSKKRRRKPNVLKVVTTMKVSIPVAEEVEGGIVGLRDGVGLNQGPVMVAAGRKDGRASTAAKAE